MVEVLLAHSYFLIFDQKQVEKMKPYPPLATLFAASNLRAAGYSVALFDAMLAQGEHEFAAALERHRPRIVALYEDNFNFLSKMCLTRMREAACTMIGMARATGATVFVSGADVSDHPELYLRHGAHAALLGEPDHTLREVVKLALDEGWRTKDQGQNPDSEQAPLTNLHDSGVRPSSFGYSLFAIPGLALPDPDEPGGVHRTPRRPVERHPDVFPQPAWDLVDVERYRAAWVGAHGYLSLNMVSTRGCPFHCNWCAKPIWGQRYAMRSPAAVADELAALKRTHRPDHIWFADDIFGLRPQWVAAFGREVADRDASVPFTIQSRADLMTEEAVEGLRLAGCAEVWMGAESGSQKVLDAMEKGTKVAQIRVARERLRRAGIRACFFIQFGYPGETLDDILATVELVRTALPDNIGVSVSYPLPGTRFYEMVREQIGPKANWSDSGDLAMMFQGTYRSPFYRHLHRLLHHELEARQQIAACRSQLDDPANAAAAQATLDQLLPALDQLPAHWYKRRQLAAPARSAAPTMITGATIRLAAPDLSKEYN
jgi:anaerobic magnesium-protoporphyrin IX monomethyl ester cyclase